MNYVYNIIYMGVHNLSKILQKYCPESIIRTKIENYKDKIIGIDASIFFYKYIYVSNKYNKPNHYLQLFFQQIINMLQNNITPIYIFDGKAPKAKETEQIKRKSTRNDLIDKISIEKQKIEQLKSELQKIPKTAVEYNINLQIIKNQEFKLKSQQDTIIHVTDNHIKNLKGLLTILSIPYIQGYAETDPLSSQLCKDGLLDYILSEDMDYIPLGCPKLLRIDRTPQDFNQEKFLIQYDYHEILRIMNLTSTQMIDMCILCGCDYVDQLYKIGPMSVYKLIEEHKTIENILNHIDHDKHKVPEHYLEFVNNARRCFMKKHTHKITRNMLKINKPDINRINDFLNQFCTFSSYEKNKYINYMKTF